MTQSLDIERRRRQSPEVNLARSCFRRFRTHKLHVTQVVRTQANQVQWLLAEEESFVLLTDTLATASGWVIGIVSDTVHSTALLRGEMCHIINSHL